jgi:hypothetical protein
MASTVPSLESRDLTEWTQLEDQEPHTDEEASQKRKWKGKSKDLEFRGFDAEMGVSDPNALPSLDEREEGGEVGGSYPPMSEEAAEEREVAEVS